MLMTDYYKSGDNPIQPEIYKCLSKVAQEISKVVKHLEV
jgi:hypothetical protein